MSIRVAGEHRIGRYRFPRRDPGLRRLVAEAIWEHRKEHGQFSIFSFPARYRMAMMARAASERINRMVYEAITNSPKSEG